MNDTINRYLTILCLPLNSLRFFEKDYIKEILDKKKKISDIGRELKKDVILDIQREQYLYSYDEIYQYIDKCFLYDIKIMKEHGCSNVFYLEYINKIARSIISQRDGIIIFKYWKNQQDKNLLGGFGDNNKIFLLHGLNMCMSLDTVVMSYITSNPLNDIHCLNNYYEQIEIADQQLEQILAAGVSENHIHAGAARTALDIWEGLMRPLNAENVNRTKNYLNRIFSGKSKEVFYILSAALMRIYMAELANGSRISQFNVIKNLKYLKNKFIDGQSLKQTVEKYLNDNGFDLYTYFQKLWDEYREGMVSAESEHQLIRGICNVSKDIHTSEENILLFCVFRKLKDYNDENVTQKELASLFIQYTRIKNYVFHYLVQRKSIRGLDYFQEYYRHNSQLNQYSSSMICEHGTREDSAILWEQIMRKQFQNKYLKKIEFRVSIVEKEAKFRTDVRTFLNVYKKVIEEDYCKKQGDKYIVVRSFPRVALLYHLIKREDKDSPEKCILDGQENIVKIQYGQLMQDYMQQVTIMKNLRVTIPGLDRYIVGLDAASLENATPLWAFTDAYESARDSQVEMVGYDVDRMQSLRFTFHAGEDFRHLLSGLRRMDEAVTFLKFHAGDRLGHGTVLGLDAEEWRHYNPFVVLPRIEALENYLWAYNLLSGDRTDFQATLMAYLEQRVYELSSEIYENTQGIPIQVLIKGYIGTFQGGRDKIYACHNANDVGFCTEVRDLSCNNIHWNADKLIYARHCKKFLKEMDRPINYEVTDQDIAITKAVQKILRQKFSRAGIVIEVNPSSNVVIGEIDKISDSQIYSLNKLTGNDNVMVCVNSDDPSVFNTNVANELCYIYYGMLHKGISREAALEWIEKIRKCGMDSSFIKNDEDDQAVYDRLCEIIEAF